MALPSSPKGRAPAKAVAPKAEAEADASEIFSARLSELEDRIARMELALRSQLNISSV